MKLLSAVALVLTAACTARAALAREVTFPITLDERFLVEQLERSAYTDPGDTARVFEGEAGCNGLVLFDPEVATRDGRLVVRTAGEARIGVAAGNRCLLPVTWSGLIELIEEPVIERERPVVRFRVVDSKILDPDGEKPLVSSILWGWVKDYVHPRLEAEIDLAGPLAELRSLLPTFGVAPPGSPLEGALRSVSLAGVDVGDGVIRVRVRIEVPDAALVGAASPTPAQPVPPLTAEELQRWESALRQWDAFLTFVVKVTGSDTKVVALRTALLEILLDERYALLDALASPEPAVRDPVRPLFLRTWKRLAPVLREVSDKLPADDALRYLSFVSAGDALAALDQLGPESGIEISADGLRRFARLVAPATVEDPLTYGFEVDPALRELFGFGPPIPPPAENPEVEPTSWFASTAWAADAPDEETLARLNSWAPTRADVHEYAPLVAGLLRSVAAALIEEHDVDEHVDVFRALVPATAWQESCWRQFVKRGGKLVPLTSQLGSIGIMQVNVSVWRGFYDVNGLRRDIHYNARAGGEILAKYWTDYAVARREREKGGGPDALAQATYAAYNGGPSQLSRYRTKGRSKRERAVDRAFLEKYQRMKKGDHLAVIECFTD